MQYLPYIKKRAPYSDYKFQTNYFSNSYISRYCTLSLCARCNNKLVYGSEHNFIIRIIWNTLMKFLDKMYTFLIWLVAHIQTTDHEMSPVGVGWGCMVRCGMTAGYIGDFSSGTGRNGRHFYHSHRKHQACRRERVRCEVTTHNLPWNLTRSHVFHP